ncbi:hypothetical protein Pfo_017572 [Paulownia fortunei]|nr:hypothetical protein Pfo_017572 [Paulownia fortunei]
MRTLSSESCKEPLLNALNPELWLQVDKGKLSKFAPQSPSSMYVVSMFCRESLIKVPEPPILPYYKPVDYVKFLAQIHEELESCPREERSNLFLFQYQVFKGFGEVKLITVCEKLVFGAWLKYEKHNEKFILTCCHLVTFPLNFLQIKLQAFLICPHVTFQIGDEKIACDRHKIAGLSAPLHAMLNGYFTESFSDDIDLSENNTSPSGMRAISDFSKTGSLSQVSPSLLLEILDACDKKLASLVSSRQDAVALMECALEENSPLLAASCLQVFLHELPDSLQVKQVIELLSGGLDRQQRPILLSGDAMDSDPSSDRAVLFLKQLVECAGTSRQKMVVLHLFGCVRFFGKESDEAEKLFEAALSKGHVYSVSYEKINSVISSYTLLGCMYQERFLYSDGDERWGDLEKATELDPTLSYAYMNRAASLMRKQDVQLALAEINRILGFKLALECLELRFCFYLALEEYQCAISDVEAILTLCPDYRLFDGRVAASQPRILVQKHVENRTTADCWLQLYYRWSLVDDIGSLSVIYQMLESDAAKGVLYLRQSLLLLRCLQLARQHAPSEPERLVYEGWILYDTGIYYLQRSFEANFLKAYALADSSHNPSCSSTVVSLLEEALKCPSDRLRKDAAADCYINALKDRHTRGHQGLGRVHFLRNDKNTAYAAEMTKLIAKARNNASAYEKRSEYCKRKLTKADLDMVTRLDPLHIPTHLFPKRSQLITLNDPLTKHLLHSSPLCN